MLSHRDDLAGRIIVHAGLIIYCIVTLCYIVP
jgi:hypothetical protein